MFGLDLGNKLYLVTENSFPSLMRGKDAARSGRGSQSDEPGAVGADEASDLTTSFAIKLRKALDAP